MVHFEAERSLDGVGRDAAILSAVEIGLGSLLHSFHVPFAGHFLSLNQGFLLSRATLHPHRSPTVAATISNVAALLKSLSPAGKKLTPMLAISAQGLFFSIGPLLLGPNALGILVGMVLLSLWGFLQPFLIYYLLFGKVLIPIAQYFYQHFHTNVVFVLAGLVILKIVLALATGIAAYILPESRFHDYCNRLLSFGKTRRTKRTPAAPEPNWKQTVRLAWKDLMNPFFLISFGLTLFFLLFVESSKTQLIWGLLRPLAIGFILFFAIRAFRFEYLARESESSFGRSLRTALRTLKEI